MMPGSTYSKENKSQPIASKYYAKTKAKLSYNIDFLTNNTIADTRTRYPLIQEDYKVDLMVNSGTHRVAKNKSFNTKPVVIISPIQMVIKEALKKPEARRYLKNTIAKELKATLPNRIYQGNATGKVGNIRLVWGRVLQGIKLGSSINQVAGMILNPSSIQITAQIDYLVQALPLPISPVYGSISLVQMRGRNLMNDAAGSLTFINEVWTDGDLPLATFGCERWSWIKVIDYIPFCVSETAPTFIATINSAKLEKIYLVADSAVEATVYSGDLYWFIAGGTIPAIPSPENDLSYSCNWQLNYTCQ